MSCWKRTYLKKSEAKRAIQKMKAFGNDGAIQVYRCRYCERWHLGHPTQRDMLIKRGIVAAS